MANAYKVPQDVEADDKLLGPFTFRQFIYLIIVALSIAAAWGLAQIFIGLAVIPLPIIILFGALALPLRKDQPMEIYLAAMISFFLKPHRRLWDPEGVETLIEITAPKTVEESRTKSLSGDEAEQRLGYLANIVDSGGWAIRGGGATPNSSMISDVYYDAQNTTDVLDTNNSVAQSFNYMMAQRAEQQKQEALQRMRESLAATPEPEPQAQYNPYPASMQQQVIQPLDDPAHQFTNPAAQPADDSTNQPFDQTATSTSDTPVSPDIMNLATNPDLSVETIAHEANRLQQKQSASDEVVVSLR